MENITEEYISKIRNGILKIYKIIIGNKYNRYIIDIFLDEYIYYRYISEKAFSNQGFSKYKMISLLKETKEKIDQDDELKDKQKELEEIWFFMEYIIELQEYILTSASADANKSRETLDNEKLDNVIENIISSIMKRRGLQDSGDEIRLQLKDVVDENIDEIKKVLNKKNKISDFYLTYTDFTKNIMSKSREKEIKKVNLRYNIDFPMIYSISAIEKTFNEEIINEDKSILQYNMLSLKVIEDNIKGNINIKYIVDFPLTVVKKEQKRKRLLKVLNTDILKDKIIIKINYREFKENIEYIYSLIKQGFNISILIDQTFKENYTEKERLKLFAYIIVNESSDIFGYIENSDLDKDKILVINNDFS